MTKPEMIALAKQTADRYALPADIICAICEKESSWNPCEIRFELGWYARKDWPHLLAEYPYPDWTSKPTEIASRSMSWGLMQALGESVRELGFSGWLPELTDPATGIEWGCRVLNDKMRIHSGNVTASLLSYNGGGDAGYALDVTQKANYYRNSGLA